MQKLFLIIATLSFFGVAFSAPNWKEARSETVSLLKEYINKASAIPIPKKPLTIKIIYSFDVNTLFQIGISSINIVIIKQIKAIVFLRALIKNGEIVELRDLNITTAKLQNRAAIKEKSSPGNFIY